MSVQMNGAEIKSRLVKLTTTDVSDERDEQLVAGMFNKILHVPAAITCGMVYIGTNLPISIQAAAKMIVKGLSLPL